ncbi:MAG: sugar transferase [Cyanobacteria bacterium J06641_5]
MQSINFRSNTLIARNRDRADLIVASKLKRALDIAGAIVGLGITALLFFPVAIALKLDSPGPIFFQQTRVGLRGQRFTIWKFRSMVVNAEQLKSQVVNQASGHFFKNDCDPRITRFGGFLRKTSLDEFPQFLNVLMGDMSLVGTRPPTVDEVEGYDPHHWRRLNVKPGLTGEWQVRGRSSVKDFEAVVRLDVEYQQKWSVLYDLQIILRTVAVVLLRRGAV